MGLGGIGAGLEESESGSMIPVDLSANHEGWIYDPNGSEIQVLGIRSRIRFQDPRSTDMSVWFHMHNICRLQAVSTKKI